MGMLRVAIGKPDSELQTERHPSHRTCDASFFTINDDALGDKTQSHTASGTSTRSPCRVLEARDQVRSIHPVC